MSKPDKGWCVVDPHGNRVLWTTHRTRKGSIDKLIHEFERGTRIKYWKFWYNRGYRCVKVTVTEGWE